MNRERLVLEPLAGHEGEIGLFLAALNDSRQRTKEDIFGLDAATIDRTTPAYPNSIGTLLYHIAAIEMDWLYCEILERDFPEQVMALLPYDVRDAKGRLTAVMGVSLEDHLARLDATRAVFLEALQGMTQADFYRCATYLTTLCPSREAGFG